jgi:PhnB protein
MTKQSIYILFDGTAKEAMEFYQFCLGGTLQLTKVGDSVFKNMLPEIFHSKILNGRLQGDLLDISTSDWLRPDETPVRGNMNCLYISGGTVENTKILFEKLSADGNITDPLKIEPFGTYGALYDKFGVRWMFHAE